MPTPTVRHCRPDRQSPPHGTGVGPSGHEVVGAPDAVPPLAPTMSLTSSRTPRPSQLDASPSGAYSPQSSPFALAREPVAPATRFFPTPSIVPPTPLPSPSPPRRIFPARRQDGISGILVFLECWHSLAKTILAVFGPGWADMPHSITSLTPLYPLSASTPPHSAPRSGLPLPRGAGL